MSDMKKILETERLYLREMTQDDFLSLCEFLKDAEVMYAYEHAFSDDEVQKWLDNQLRRYREDGFGLWAIVLKENGKMIGDCGITMQMCKSETVHEIGYHLTKSHWHKGYASEAAIACRKYAFEKLNIDEIFSIIRDTNKASQKVAERNGMKVCDTFIKHYYGIDMLHLCYSVKK